MSAELIEADVFDFLRGNQWLVQNGHVPKAHAVIADPPYFLGSIARRFGGRNAAPAQFGKDGAFQRQSRGFMGKTWDGFDDVWQYQAWVTAWAELLLDFVYPGAILAMFGGTRTYHRLAAGLEDAGWEVFDCMMYLYGSGFPKAADIGKLIDRSEGTEREIVGYGDGGLQDNYKLGDDGWYGANCRERMFPIGKPSHPDAQRFDGYKTALKPAYEPIVLARAPRGSATYAELAQMWGTGALNVDAGRIEASGDYKDFGVRYGASSMQQMGGFQTRPYVQERIANRKPINTSEASKFGRYPSNLILDEVAAALLDAQSGNCKAGSSKTGNEPSARTLNVYGKMQNEARDGYADSGGASRFFYTAKAARWEREAGLENFDPQTVTDGRPTPIDNAYQRGETQRRNTHPTVKPIQLIEYIARLLLPPVLDVPRRVLVPFAGSGSEMIGCQLAGWEDVVGIEREAEYCAINRQRVAWWSQFASYEAAKSTQQQDALAVEVDDSLDQQLDLFAYAQEAQP